MMWTRKEVKERAKEALKRNYWKAVLVSFILILLGGGGGSAPAFGRAISDDSGTEQTIIETEANDIIILENEGLVGFNETGTDSLHTAAEEVGSAVTEAVDTVLAELEETGAVVFIVFGVVLITIFLIVFAVIIVFDVLVVNPLCIGAQRFMLKSVDETGNLSELGFAFDHNYKNAVKTTFVRDLHILLGAICFVIPGIYMNYQYYMVDYILAENPDMPYKEVLARSKNMMNGQKWHAFVLDLSFILWHMLSMFTCGILEIFYVEPYIQLTRASLYRRLNGGHIADSYQNMTAHEVVIDAE